MLPRTIAVVLTVFAAVLGGLWFLENWAGRPAELDSPATIVIERGESFSAIGQRLNANRIVDSARWLTLRARMRGLTGSVKAGEYRFESNQSPDRVLDRLASGDILVHSIQITEGETFSVTRNKLLHADGLWFDLGDATVVNVLAVLELADAHGEGQFFPDTYHYRRGDRASEVLVRAWERMRLQLDNAWEKRDADLPLKSPYEVLILASIIEKESGMEGDRRKISGVFSRRLRQGMRLQTDPAVIYGLGRTFDGNLTRAHLRKDGPYNTYTRGGLPPTPISAAGLTALHAATQPDSGTALYFVARGDGSSQFSDTLDAHLQAVRRYQLRGER